MGAVDPSRGWRSRLGRWLIAVAWLLVRWVTPRWALLLTIVVGFAVAATMGALSAEVYESVTESDGVAGLDRPLLDQALQWRSPTLNHAVTLFTDLGGPVGMTVLATTVTVLLAVWWRSWTPVLLMAVATAGSLLMTTAGKAVIGRTRPPQVDAVPPYETSASFPSGHSLNAVVVAGIVVYLLLGHLRRRWAKALTVLVAVVFAMAMGLSRVYLGHHWFTDVLVAWTIGLAWLAVVLTVHRLVLVLGRTSPRDGGTPQGARGRSHH